MEKPMQKIRLALVIHSLEAGGAERQLLTLAKGLDKKLFTVVVITFYQGGTLQDEILGAAGIELLNLRRKNRWEAPLCLVRLAKELKRSKIDVVYGFMETPAQMSLLAGSILGIKVIWGLRRSHRELSHYDWAERVSFRTGRVLSAGADAIVLNSFAGKEDYVKVGYCSKKMLVIHNGIDTNRFRRDSEKGASQRKSWGIEPEAKVVGMVSRLHPMKGHEVFLRAAQKVASVRSDVYFVCAGRGEKDRFLALRALAARFGLEKRVFWPGEVKDVVGLYSALDVVCLCSIYGEGFPNVVGEAMSCGVPCVVSDVGDSALLVGETGLVVSRGDHEQLATSLLGLLCRPREELSKMGELARARVIKEFSVDKMICATTKVIQELVYPSQRHSQTQDG